MVNVGEYTIHGAFGTEENVVFIHACAVPAPRVVLEHPSATSEKMAQCRVFLPIESIYLGNLL